MKLFTECNPNFRSSRLPQHGAHHGAQISVQQTKQSSLLFWSHHEPNENGYCVVAFLPPLSIAFEEAHDLLFPFGVAVTDIFHRERTNSNKSEVKFANLEILR